MDGAVTVAYLAPADLEHEVRDELSELGVRVRRRHGRLFITDDPPVDSLWSANVWRNGELVPVTSIGDTARALRARQRNWATYAPTLSGRAKLVTEKLPHVSAKPLAFGAGAPEAPLGSWTFLEPNLVLAATECSSPFPNGEPRIVEDRVGPPSRAYLKLWETFARLRRWPGPGDRCLDLGASPGGWTWVLARTGATVVSVDKAPLDPAVERLANVACRRGSAFAIVPRDHSDVDWLVSDIICYPRRLLGLVERWLDAGTARNLVCTIKFQGETDRAIAREFASIPGARVMHLHHNRHELTFALVDDRSDDA
jgi:23S rRNA (cytidine2498-2'-O)-methyltransferase